jgi:hypothetical protein
MKLPACPKCGHDVCDRVAEDLYCCRECHHYFNLVTMPPVAPEWKVEAASASAPTRLPADYLGVRSMARFFSFAALLCFVIAVIAVLLTAIDNGGAAMDPSQQLVTGYIVAAVFFSLALWLFLIAQIIHIRANMEK